MERSRGFTLWIRFGSISLSCLLEGVEDCCRGEFAQRLIKSWEDGGRKFTLECQANEADRFLLCTVVDSEGKKFCLVFLEGKGILGGWTLLAEKLRSLGVSTHDEPREVLVFSRTESRVGAHEGKAKNSYVDAVKTRARRLGEPVWLQLGEEDVLSGRKMLDWCLVGRWGESPVSAPDLSALGRWGKYHWNLKGVKFARLGGPFILIEFENKAEADKVLLRGFRCFKDLFLHLERWDPKVGCSQYCEQIKEVWVRVVGLPLHFWSREVFRKIGDCCRGFVAVDENTATFKELQWARLLVKSKRLKWPNSL